MKAHKKFTGLLITIILFNVYIPQSFAHSQYHDRGYSYAGFGVSMSSIALNETNLSIDYTGKTGAKFDHNGSAAKLFLGFQVDPLLGVEIGFTDFSELVMTSNNSTRNLFMASGAYLAGTATKSLSKNVHAIAKLGMFSWELRNNKHHAKESGEDLYYGLGLDFNVFKSDQRSLLLEWEHYTFSNVAYKNANTLGISLKFLLK